VPKALVLVRNPVTHDSRVLREARLLREFGFDTLVVGVVSPEERQTELKLDDGTRIVRLLGPLQLARQIVRRANGSEADGTIQRRSAAPRKATRAAGLRRFIVACAFNVQGVALAWRVSPDLVHANDYDTMWIGIAAKLLRGSRLVYDAHELWPDQNRDSGWRPWLIACEWLFVHVADARLTVSPGCAEEIARRYRVTAPVVVRNVPERVLDGAEPRTDEPPVAVYVGILAPARGIEQAVRALPAVPGLRLQLIGPDAEGFSAEIVRAAEHASVADRVEVFPPVPPSEVPDAIARAQIGLVLIQPTSLSYRLSLPNKLFEYAAAGVPVLASDLPVIGPLVREAGIGEVVAPDDVDGIAAAMHRLVDAREDATLRQRVRAFALRTTWAQERHVLESVYASLPPRRRESAAS